MELILQDKSPATAALCNHCGDQCPSDRWKVGEHMFCCGGCKLVYEILHENQLEHFYSLNEHAGLSQKNVQFNKYEYLENTEVINKLVAHIDGTVMTIWLSLPTIHCSSCLWLLENISRLNEGIKHSTVNFLDRKALIHFDSSIISLLFGELGSRFA